MPLVPHSPVSAQSVDRPVVMVASYAASTVPARGEDFNLSVIFKNNGQKPSYNMFIEFVSGELIPLGNGGTQSIYQLVMGESKGVSQGFKVSPDLWGATVASVTVNLEYSDDDGNAYSDSFTISIDLKGATYVAATPTPTSSPLDQPQIVIPSYETDVEILQPGTSFELKLDVMNLGNTPAKVVSMVLGGGSVEINAEGTPQPGISGGEGEFSNFAPLNSSNIQFLGDIGPGESLVATQKIIVNVATTPGAYPLKFSFIYTTETGEKVVDNQVITLLVYQMPVIDVSFYQDPGTLFAQQPTNLPLQVVNLGKQTVVLGNMQVKAENASLENNIALVGAVEAGFYFTLDTLLIPDSAGPMDLNITINYTDDFNQPRVYETVLSLEIEEAMPMPDDMGMVSDPNGEMPSGEIPGMEMPFPEGDIPGTQETFWQKLLRGIKGLFGLDSGPSPSEQDFFPEDTSNYENMQSVPPVKGP
jgi:hypothetical protein